MISSARVYSSDLSTSAEVLLATLNYARDTDDDFTISPLSAAEALSSGLSLYGDISELLSELRDIDGVVIYSE